jgi:hydroxymethylpyrimidine/phosphomethylpyrimidine kinase
MSAITAITAQNTVAVTAVYPLPPEAIVAQVRAVAEDIGVDAVKIGMVGNRAAIEAVAEALELVGDQVPVVLDPVMIAESGGRLLDEDAEDALRTTLVPRATVVTPNVPEARVLGRVSGEEADEPEALAEAVHALGPEAVVVTGGHGVEAVDVFFDGKRMEAIQGPRYGGGSAHGSGCTHSSVLAVHLARGDDPLEAAKAAKAIAGEAVKHGLAEIGQGPGPVDVMRLGS